MASDAFLNSIEVNFKKATRYIQKIDGSEAFSEDLANQIMLGNATYLVRFGVRLRGIHLLVFVRCTLITLNL